MCADVPRQFAPGSRPNGGYAAPTPAELRAACYAILRLAETEKDVGVKRILAADAFALAQQAQLQSSPDAADKARTA